MGGGGGGAVSIGATGGVAEAPGPSVRSALAKGDYPWYDARADAPRALWPPPEARMPDGATGRIAVGDALIFALFTAGLAALIVALARGWRSRRATSGSEAIPARIPGAPARLEDLPAGVRPGTADPWAEAARLRARGDLAGAVVALFAAELLMLDRRGLARLALGRTGRQVVGDVIDPAVRGAVEPTLRLFEAVYYGHRHPSAEAFEDAWSRAEALRRRIDAGGRA